MKSVVAENLVETYKKGEVRALDGLNLDAGQTTVGVVDVFRHPGKVREIIGLSGQCAAADEILNDWDAARTSILRRMESEANK